MEQQDRVEVRLEVVDLVLEPVAPDPERDPLAGRGLEGVPIDVLGLADRARGGDRQAQHLRPRGLVVRLVVGLGDDRAVHHDDQADRRDPLRRRDPDLAGTERSVGRHGQPRLDRALHRPSSPSRRPRSSPSTSPASPGALAEQLPGPREIARPRDRDLGRRPPLERGRLDAAQHRIRRLRPRRPAARAARREDGQDPDGIRCIDPRSSLFIRSALATSSGLRKSGSIDDRDRRPCRRPASGAGGRGARRPRRSRSERRSASRLPPSWRRGLDEGGLELAGVGVPDPDQAVPAAGGGAAAVVRERRGVLPLGRARAGCGAARRSRRPRAGRCRRPRPRSGACRRR